ncbi:MAG: ArnT family glycosyltransferase, partial [Tepidisphaeraceae bacterium]
HTYHADEPTKVEAVRKGRPNFRHPALLVQAARVPVAVLGLGDDPQGITRAGRFVSAVAGAMLAGLAYVLARQASAGRGWAALAGLAVATSPIVVVHAHYFKEDVVFAAMTFLALACLGPFVRKPDDPRVWALGIATGLALSSKYAAAVLLPVYAVVLLVNRPRGARAALFGRLGWALLIALGVFLLINYPALLRIKRFWAGLAYETVHAVTGHGSVSVGPLEYWLGFHLRFSLIDGMTLAVAFVGVASLLVLATRFRALSPSIQGLVLFTVIYYLATELSPMKTFPAYVRYMVPVAAALIVCACVAADRSARAWRPAVFVIAPGLVAAFAWAALDAGRLVYHLDRDTRATARQWVLDRGLNVKGDHYSGVDWRAWSLPRLDPATERATGVDAFVGSSFMYDRVYFAMRLSDLGEEVRGTHAQYEKLFRLPYVEFRPAYRTFAFSNPVIRVIDLRAPVPSSDPAPAAR